MTQSARMPVKIVAHFSWDDDEDTGLRLYDPRTHKAVPIEEVENVRQSAHRIFYEKGISRLIHNHADYILQRARRWLTDTTPTEPEND